MLEVFIGVILGGVLTGLSNWRLDVWRDGRRRRDEVEGRRHDLKGASRLVKEELFVNRYTLHKAIATEGWWSHQGQALKTNRWSEHEPVFAGADVSGPVWGTLIGAYQGIRDLNAIARERSRSNACRLTADDKEDLRLGIKSIDRARLALAEINGEAALAGEPTSSSLLTNAATRAAHRLLAGSNRDLMPLREGDELVVVSNEHPVLGIAALEIWPGWDSYLCELPLESRLSVVLPSIDGTRACAVKPVFDRGVGHEAAHGLVPYEIHARRDYHDFVFLLDFPGDRMLVSGQCEEPRSSPVSHHADRAGELIHI
ncbi:MAG TPA: hypothetical protein VIS95_01180 [Solirubrobacterales bacterium]